MEIEILKKLQSFTGEKKPLAIGQIEFLENKFNSAERFPQVLRELLFLAGESCEILAYFLDDSQEGMQDSMREWLTDEERSLNRPFYVIDVYNFPDGFVFVYLDTTEKDPVVFSANIAELDFGRPFVRSLDRKLSEYLNVKIQLMESGASPF